MPAIGFKCPNSDKEVAFDGCVHFPVCGSRCLALPAIQSVINSIRPWKGKPSVTQLLKPTRQVYLEITKDYYIDPMGSIAAMIGTNSHKAFEDNVPNGWLSEVRLEDDITSGQFDAYDCTTGTLWDWKFFGAFRIAKALGLRSRWEQYTFKRGKKKGETEWRQVYEMGGVRDVREIAIQLNYYRYLMENHGLHVNSIKVNMFVRGGIDATAKKYGITQAGYVVPINFISLSWVRRYMTMKYDALMRALDTDIVPPVCSKRDRWDTSKSYPDRKCRDYCSVNKYCDYYIENYGVI